MKALKDFQKEVAIKYGLGESLVMGHRKTYFDEAAIEFTKYHVEAALEAAAKKAKIIDDPNSYTGNTGSEYPPDQIVSDESILKAYPLTNIK